MTVSREKLYEEVWAEPMVRVAARYDVSSSFLARVCTRLRVPHPERGYWEQREVDRAGEKPPLPTVLPGDETEWNQGGPATRAPRALPQAPAGRSRSVHPPNARPTRHGLVVGARELFESGRVEMYGYYGYLRPAKRRLVDLFVSKATLERALDLASALYLALEDRGHRVVLPRADEHLVRSDLQVRPGGGVPPLAHNHWEPDRPTVVMVGTVAIALTVFEFTDYVEARWTDGGYVRVPQPPPGRRPTRAVNFVGMQDLPSGRLGIRASSPYGATDWVRQWGETEAGDLSTKVAAIAREIEAGAPKLAAVVAEAHRRKEAERKELEDRWATMEREEAERLRVQNIEESRRDLLAAIDAWGAVRRIEGFFEAAEQRAATLPEAEADAVRERLRHARALIGEADPLRRLLAWKAPEER